MIKIGNLQIDKFYLGDSSNVKIYLGDVKVWPQGGGRARNIQAIPT